MLYYPDSTHNKKRVNWLSKRSLALRSKVTTLDSVIGVWKGLTLTLILESGGRTGVTLIWELTLQIFWVSAIFKPNFDRLPTCLDIIYADSAKESCKVCDPGWLWKKGQVTHNEKGSALTLQRGQFIPSVCSMILCLTWLFRRVKKSQPGRDSPVTLLLLSVRES